MCPCFGEGKYAIIVSKKLSIYWKNVIQPTFDSAYIFDT